MQVERGARAYHAGSKDEEEEIIEPEEDNKDEENEVARHNKKSPVSYLLP